MRFGSLIRWFFENRETGDITIAQFPNWPLFGVAGGWIIAAIAPDGSTLENIARVAVTVLFLYWGVDELVRGVNPWRRILGAGVVLWQLTRVVGMAT